MPFGLNLSPLALRAAGGFAAIVAVLALFAWVYHSGYEAGVKAEQKRTDPKVEAICQASGSVWSEKADRKKWGGPCTTAVKALAAFKADAIIARTKLLEDHAKDQEQKTVADTAAAKRDDQAVTVAKQRMEAKDAAVQNDRVDGGWFAGLNELGGLRKP